jgi:large subunit ribosomal protein L15
MKLHELSPAPGSRKKAVRVGRGLGSGLGKTCGRGHKGQNARSGGGTRPGFEGGQRPLYLRLPKRGFHNKFGKEFVTVNVGALDIFADNALVDLAALKEKRLVKNPRDGVRILGGGELTKALTVKASGFSKSAEEKIKASGGKIEVI